MAKEIHTSGVLGRKKEIMHRKEHLTNFPIVIERPPNPRPKDVLISNDMIMERINQMASDIVSNHKDENLLVIFVLTGGMTFGVHLGEALHTHGLEDANFDVIRGESYKGQRKAGKLKVTAHPKCEVKGRNVLIVEDIVDSGETMTEIERYLIDKGARSITSAALVSKRDSRKVPYEADYTGFEIPKIWIEGFGLDTDEEDRNNPNIIVGYERQKKIKPGRFPLLATSIASLAKFPITRHIFSRKNNPR